MAYEHVPSSRLYRIAAQYIAPALHERGFRSVGKRSWVRGQTGNDAVRAVIELTAPTSWAGSYPVWGFDLSYVPLVSYATNFAICWPGDPNELKIDLGFDPPESQLMARPSEWWIPSAAGEDAVRQATQLVLNRLLAHALPQLDAVRSVADLPDAFEIPRRRRFELGLRADEKLAYAFTLARLNRAPDGLALLDQFIAHFQLMPHKTRNELRELYQRVIPQP